jgi:predicted RNA-binding Zn-ribbon protein involved in translation (DUF1610 family)
LGDMSTVRILPAETRIDRCEFSRLPEHVVHNTDIGTYKCPHCGSSVEFRTKHFEKHFDSTFTNLDLLWHERFTAKRPVRDSDWESFLDFLCPGCNAPVRIIYRAGPEWAMGCHGWQLVDVVEAESWPNAASDA